MPVWGSSGNGIITNTSSETKDRINEFHNTSSITLQNGVRARSMMKWDKSQDGTLPALPKNNGSRSKVASFLIRFYQKLIRSASSLMNINSRMVNAQRPEPP